MRSTELKIFNDHDLSEQFADNTGESFTHISNIDLLEEKDGDWSGVIISGTILKKWLDAHIKEMPGLDLDFCIGLDKDAAKHLIAYLKTAFDIE